MIRIIIFTLIMALVPAACMPATTPTQEAQEPLTVEISPNKPMCNDASGLGFGAEEVQVTETGIDGNIVYYVGSVDIPDLAIRRLWKCASQQDAESKANEEARALKSSNPGWKIYIGLTEIK